MKDLIDIASLTNQQIKDIITLAGKYYKSNKTTDKTYDLLKGKEVINLFFENSTRTTLSFELASKRLGATVVNLNLEQSSVKKGECLDDTITTISAMSPDFIVVRHGTNGAARQVAQLAHSHVINAGDGNNAHPTQALLDLAVIMQHKPNINGLKIVICGDIKHSRVARSDIEILTRFGANITLIAPPNLLPDADYIKQYNLTTDSNLQNGIKDADVIMLLRIQHERIDATNIPSKEEYYNQYGLKANMLNTAKPNCIIMHPGPVNRGIEIEQSLIDSSNKTVILQQVEMGVAIRMAVLEYLHNCNIV